MRKPPRIAVLIAALAAVGLWIAFDKQRPADTPSGRGAPATEDAKASGAATPPAVASELPMRERLARMTRDPFSAGNWLPARPKASAPSAPAPVVAPPLPYRFVGQFRTPDATQTFLAKGDDTFPIREGETLDGQYRVESVGANDLVLLHLASNTRQTLQFGLPGDDLKNNAVQVAQAPAGRAAPANVPASSPLTAAKTVASAPGDDAKKAASAQPAELRWDGPASAKAGASFDVTLRLTSDQQVRSAPMQVRYDPSLLETVSVRPGSYFGAVGRHNFGYRVNSDGSIYIGASNPAGASASDAELLVLTFKTKRAAAAAEVSVSALNLQGPAGRAIAYNSLSPFKTTIVP